MLSRRRLLVLTLSAAAGAPAVAQDPAPAAIVASIYGKDDAYGAAASLQMRAPRRPALSPALAALWQRSDANAPDGDEPVPGFDVASNSQDRDIANAEVTVERQNATHATVAAKLISEGPRVPYPASDDIVRYDFIRAGGRWQIDDVRSSIHGKPWSLRGLLTEGLAPH